MGRGVPWPRGDLGSTLPEEPGPSSRPLSYLLPLSSRTSCLLSMGRSHVCLKTPLGSQDQFAFCHSFVFVFLSAQGARREGGGFVSLPVGQLRTLSPRTLPLSCSPRGAPCLGSCRSSGLWVTEPRLGAGDARPSAGPVVGMCGGVGGGGRWPLRKTKVA